jgi:hypothetical protein
VRICPPDPLDSLPLQSPRDPAQSRGDTEVGTKEFVSIVRTDPFSTLFLGGYQLTPSESEP